MTFDHIAPEDMKGLHVRDTHSTRGPRPFGFYLSYETCVALGKYIFVEHLPPAEVQRLTGVSRRTIYRFRKKLPLLASKCRCGRDYGHAGFCRKHKPKVAKNGQYYLPFEALN